MCSDMSLPSDSREELKLEAVFAGVGGQGIITMGRVLGVACSRIGLNIITAETHGMSQRMGLVEFFVRIGNVWAPLVSPATADVVVALEMIEALRAVKYLRKCGWLLVSNIYIPPPNAAKAPSRKDILDALKRLPVNAVLVDVEKIVEALEDYRVVNMAMLGSFLALEEVSKIIPAKVVENVVEEILGPVNRKAFEMGYEQTREKIASRDFVSLCGYT